MPTAIDLLKHEHRVIERALRALEGVCRRLDRGEHIPAETLTAFLGFIRTFADHCHHAKEEKHLFPALEQRGIPRAGGPIGVMLHEHEVGRGLVAELDRLAQAYQRGNPDAAQRFVEVARHYGDLLTNHIHKEDHVLFPMAQQVLDELTMRSLEQAFEQTEIELGADGHERYERLAAELESRWASS